MSTIKGQNLRVLIGTKCIAAATNCSVHFAANLEDTSTKDDTADWGSQECTSKSWDVSVDALVVATDSTGEVLTDLLGKIGTEVTINFQHCDGTQNREADTKKLVTGTAILSDISISAQNKSNGTYTAQFTGKGAPTFDGFDA